MKNANNRSELQRIFADYGELPEYSGIRLENVNQKSLFGDRPINIAATRGSINEINTLLEEGADINNKGEHSYTPLHNAVEQGHRDVVIFLLSRGADKDVKNIYGQTPADLADLLNEDEIKKLL